MKKLLLIALLVFSANTFASTASLLIVNNTPFYVNYHLITFPPVGNPQTPQISTTGNSLGLIQMSPNSSINYNDPATSGLPYYLINNWTISTTTSNTPISGASAYANYGSRFRWGKFKFSVSYSANMLNTKTSGNCGPMGDTMNWVLDGISVVWTQVGTQSIVTISLA